jgi:hypothetical protein
MESAVWTPKRILLLATGFGLFFAAYVVYAYFLGGINGLPPLPEGYGPIAEGPLPIAPGGGRENEADNKLGIAFGPECDEVKARNIKVELPSRGMVLAAKEIAFVDGKVKLTPFSLAMFGKQRDGEKFPEITTVQANEALLTFDKPINNIADMGSNVRKITAGELSGDIRIINNRRTPERDDDLSLFTQGPLFYQESLHRVWTAGAVVDLMDLQSKPNPMEIRGTGMHLYLAADNNAGSGAKTAGGKANTGSSMKVERIELESDVDMNLWVDPRSGFLGGGKDGKEVEKAGLSASKPVAATAPAAQASAQTEKARVKIMTQGPFRYDLVTDRATFDISHHSGPNNVVTVDRFEEKEDKTDHLECDHLEIQFLRKNASAGQTTPEDRGEGLDLETVHATGKEVILTSDAEMLEAHGNDFFHDKRAHLSILKGTPRMWALKEGNEIEAPELQLTDVKGAQHATALGEGHIRMLDKKTGERPLEAQWTKKLDFAKDGRFDLLALTGDASFVDHEHAQQLLAQQLKVWLEPTKEGKGSAGGEPQQPLPHHVDALGQVRAVAPDLRVHDTDHLVLSFKDAAPSAPPLPAAPPIPSSRAADQEEPNQPAKPEQDSPPTGDSSPSPAPRPGVGSAATTTAAEPSEQSGKAPPRHKPGAPAPAAEGTGPAKASSTPAKPKNPMDLSARFIDAQVLRTGGKSELDKLWCEGTVHITQEPSGPDDKGVDIRGEKLQLVRQADGNILTVFGDYAQVQLDKLYIVGPEVNIDQTTNYAEVHGTGVMRLPSNGNLYGTKLAPSADAKPTPPSGTKAAPPTEVTIQWERHMLFNGLVAQFDWPSDPRHGRSVQAEQENDRLACKAMQVTLDRMVSLREGEKGKQPANVQKVVCDQNVWVESMKRNGSRIVDYQRLDGPLLSVDNGEDKDDTLVHAGGPGTVRIFQLGTKGDLLAPPAGASPPPAKPSKKNGSVTHSSPPQPPPSKDEGETKLTRITYEGWMYANKKKGLAKFLDKVVMIHVPTDDPSLQLDENHLPPGYLYLSCEILEVLKNNLPDGKSYQEMRAYKNVAIETQEFTGNAETVKYDESKEQVILEGSDSNPAILTRQKGRGTDPDTVRGRKIIYLRSTGEYHVEAGSQIQIRQ